MTTRAWFLGSVAYGRVRAADVVYGFHTAAELHGLPASLLSDNGAVFTGSYRGGKVLLEYELERLVSALPIAPDQLIDPALGDPVRPGYLPGAPPLQQHGVDYGQTPIIGPPALRVGGRFQGEP